MKIKEILKEHKDHYNDLYKMAMSNQFGYSGTDLDAFLNPEAERIANEERKNSNKSGHATVVKTDIVDKNRKKMTTMPEKGALQSPGFRGRETVKQRAGIPHYAIQKTDKQFRPSVLGRDT